MTSKVFLQPKLLYDSMICIFLGKMRMFFKHWEYESFAPGFSYNYEEEKKKKLTVNSQCSQLFSSVSGNKDTYNTLMLETVNSH